MYKTQKLWRMLTIAALLVNALNLSLVPATPVYAVGMNSLTGFSAYTQNFDSIGTSATATLPTDWKADKQLTAQTVGTYAAAVTATERQGGNNMSTTASNGIYNYGAGDPAAATDRAVGFLSSGSATKSGNLYAYLKNDTGSALSSFNISYNVEKYRAGSNAAGFSVQLYYSLNGTTWTSASSSFLTSFPADAANTGYASAPGATTPVSSQTLTVAVPSGSDFYLAWNYSVTSGTTTSNAQALGIDDFSITPIAATPSLSVNDVSAAEGNSGTTTLTFTVSLSSPAPAGGVTFDIATADNTATAGSDYVARNLTSQTITAGSTSYTFDVTVNGDTTFEPDETFFVNVTNVTGATVSDGQGLGTIQNDDAPPPALSITDVTQPEGTSGTTTFGFVVKLDAPAPVGGVSFDIATADNTATVADNDYIANSATGVTIPEGSDTYNFDVTVNGDTKIELTETFFVNVTNVTGATVSKSQGLGTITNDDAATPNLTINDVTHDEGNSGTTTYTFTVSLDIPALAGGVTFDIATADNTATAGSDYVARNLTSQTIAAGDSTYTFDVTVNGDTTFEPNETFNVNVTNVTGANVSDGTGLGTITNDDAAPANLSINDVTVTEGNTGTTTASFTVSLDAPAPVSRIGRGTEGGGHL